MTKFEKFHYSSLEQLQEAAGAAGVSLPFSNDLSVLAQPLDVHGKTIANRLAVHPMEGADGEPDGSPSQLTKRRYERFCRGGAGLIWFEAIAVMKEARANPLQLWITDDNVGNFAGLVENMHSWAAKQYGKDFRPIIIAQLTHSGRFSRPNGTHEPIIAYHNPYLNTKLDIPADHPVVTDSYIEQVEEQIEKAAGLALRAGFDGVDLKACHRYLSSELLSAYTRTGKYGGCFENRTRFLRDCVKRVKNRYSGNLLVCSRINAYDGIPYPYGFGVDKNDYTKYDLTETKQLMDMLIGEGLDLFNFTMGTPYYNSHVNRPFDMGLYTPEESQFVGVSRMINGIGELQQAFPKANIVGTGYSWLRQFAANAAAGAVKEGKTTIAGFGREAFAYPDFPNDILHHGGMDPNKICISCGKCADIMRLLGPAGCVVRDSKLYMPQYKKYVLKETV